MTKLTHIIESEECDNISLAISDSIMDIDEAISGACECRSYIDNLYEYLIKAKERGCDTVRLNVVHLGYPETDVFRSVYKTEIIDENN